MSNRNNPDSEQDEQEQLEQARREQERAAALRDQARQVPGGGDDSKDPVIINRDR